MCGDPYCGSCGPAQGNNRCPICGRWSMDENDDGTMGCDNPKECEEKEAAMWAKYAEDEARYQKEMEEMGEPPAPEHCPHGNKWGECNACDVASDLAYDAMREDRAMGRFR